MTELELKINYPGLLIETLPSGQKRYRVRVEGNKVLRIKLLTKPGENGFQEAYFAARRGIQLKPKKKPEETAIRGSISWLTYRHIADMEKRVKAGLASPLTLKKRLGLMQRLRDRYGEYDLKMPTEKIIEIRDDMVETPAYADSMVEAIRSMYRWAIEIGITNFNPAIGVPKIDKGKGGAIPWSVEDLKQYRSVHKPGTNAHLALTIFMFTACRISDAIGMGRPNEFTREGILGLGWQPSKRGSAFVEVPMLPPLIKATRAQTVQGKTYLLKQNGQPYSSGDALGQHFRKWCARAGLENRTSHGIRKAAGHLLAQEGCTQYQIMCIHGHTSAKTSEIYTKGVERWKLAADAMKRLEGMEW